MKSSIDDKVVMELISELIESYTDEICDESVNINNDKIIEKLELITDEKFGNSVEAWVDWFVKHELFHSYYQETIRKIWIMCEDAVELHDLFNRKK